MPKPAIKPTTRPTKKPVQRPTKKLAKQKETAISCKDIEREIKHIKQQITKLEKDSTTEKKKKEVAAEKAATKAGDAVDDLGFELDFSPGKRGKGIKFGLQLKPKFGKGVRDGIEGKKAWDEYQRASGEIPLLEEALEFLKQLLEQLQMEQNKRCRRWKGEISCKIELTDYPRSKDSTIYHEWTLLQEHKWRISEEPVEVEETEDVAVYPALWTVTHTERVIWNDEPHPSDISTTVVDGRAQEACSITIKITGHKYILTIPKTRSKPVVRVSTTSTGGGRGWGGPTPLSMDEETLEGQLDASESIIKGSKGPISITEPYMQTKTSKTFTWHLTSNEEDSGLIA